MTQASTLALLADQLADARVKKEEADDVAKAANEVYEKIEAEMFDALEDAGIQQIRTERGLFRQNDLAWATVVDESAARAWAEANMPELLLLNRQRLSVIVRQSLKGEEGAAIPPGVDFKTSRKITWRRS